MQLKDVKPGQRFRLKNNGDAQLEMIMGALHPALEVNEVPFGLGRRGHTRAMICTKNGMVFIATDGDREVVLSAGSSAELEQRASTPPVGGSSPSPHASTTHDELVYHIGLNGVRFNGATVFFRRRKKDLFAPWNIGVALCHADDEFDPKIGERLARRRAIGPNGPGTLDVTFRRAIPSQTEANKLVDKIVEYLL